jgi:hypothetical protein
VTTDKHLFQNYAYELRGFDGSSQARPSVPRPNFTFFVEFGFNGNLENAEVLDKKFNRGNSIFVKSFTKPGFAFNTETLRSYNTQYHLKTKKEYVDVQLTLYDDSRSQARSLINGYRDHYHSQNYGTADANIEGDNISTASNLQNQSLAEGISQNPSEYSWGLRLNDVSTAKYLSHIKLIDLGTDPDAVQVYKLYDPIIKTVDNVTLDYTDGSGMQEISITLAYKYFDTYEYNNSQELHNTDGLFETALNKAVIEDTRRVNYDEKVLKKFDSILPDSVNDFLNGIGVTPGELIQAVQNSIQGGELNLDDLRRNVFETVASGTPIQNIRNVITNIRLIEQAIDQGRFTDLLPLLGEAGGQLGNLKNYDPFGSAETIQNVRDTMTQNINNAGSWLSRHLNPKN